MLEKKKLHTATLLQVWTSGISTMLSKVGFHPPLPFPLSFCISLPISTNTSSSLCSPFSFRRSSSHASSFLVSKILTSQLPSPFSFSISSSTCRGAHLSIRLPINPSTTRNQREASRV
ncbi:hypothetical protein MUK42_23806 [Musa troglodytarum]|uniref:Uncharacterized protein n=1 Tax=Musa troglodytarum TaxID=320322 RepID=A0A9E7KD43_9LILI|nr:hypothetical protein MUK42_23806 [Musa troglodytarum]